MCLGISTLTRNRRPRCPSVFSLPQDTGHRARKINRSCKCKQVMNAPAKLLFRPHPSSIMIINRVGTFGDIYWGLAIVILGYFGDLQNSRLSAIAWGSDMLCARFTSKFRERGIGLDLSSFNSAVSAYLNSNSNLHSFLGNRGQQGQLCQYGREAPVLFT